jgi:hypothetical protein
MSNKEKIPNRPRATHSIDGDFYIKEDEVKDFEKAWQDRDIFNLSQLLHEQAVNKMTVETIKSFVNELAEKNNKIQMLNDNLTEISKALAEQESFIATREQAAIRA